VWFDGSVSPLSDDSVLWIARDITERKRREAERRLIFEIIEGVISTPNLDELLKLIHQSIGKLLYAKNCCVALYDPPSNLMHFEFWVDEFDPVPPPRPIGKGFTSYVLSTGQPLLLTEELKRRMAERADEVELSRATGSWLGVPLRTASEIIGALVLQHYGDESAYSERDLEFLSSVGDQIALAISRKRAEEKLRESEERYRIVAETATDVIVTIDEDSTILFANRAVERVFGYAVSELMGKQITMLMPEYMGHVQENTISNPERTGRTLVDRDFVELPGLHRTGREIPIELSFGEFPKDGRRFVTGIARDITDRKQAEKELSKSEERYRDLVENAHDIIYSHDLQGNYTSVNNAGEKITGYSRKEALSMNLAETVAPEFIEKARQMVARKLAGEEVTAYDLEIVAKDGHRIALEINSKLVLQDGVPVGVQGIARDVTDRKGLEAQLRQSQKMEAIGRLAGGIAHDFNNLLTAINGYSELSMKRLRAEDPLLSNLQEIKKAGDRAATLTRQLLAFSRKQVLQPKVVDLNSIVSDLEKMLKRLIYEDVELHTVLEPNLGYIKVDPGQIEQIIMNLTVNARDAMPQGGKLSIETKNTFLDEEYARKHFGVGAGPYVMLRSAIQAPVLTRRYNRASLSPSLQQKG
jgi:PAS domain S-box-containing protein